MISAVNVWAAEYDRELGGVLELQAEVASAIGNEVRLKITPAQRARLASAHSVNPEAYEAYLKGRYFMEKWTEDGTEIGREYFEQAIQKDPRYALAYAGLLILTYGDELDCLRKKRFREQRRQRPRLWS